MHTKEAVPKGQFLFFLHDSKEPKNLDFMAFSCFYALLAYFMCS